MLRIARRTMRPRWAFILRGEDAAPQDEGIKPVMMQ
jgi:hypothetical protein